METIGDDIAWMKFGADGRLYAINPEAGFFGVAPGTSMKSNPNALLTLNAELDLHQLRDRAGRRRLVGGHDGQGAAGADGLAAPAVDAGRRPEGGAPERAVHGARRQCPVIAPEWEDPKGVPISAMLFGGRRATVVPLVTEAFNWQHGTFLGSIMGSETTAAAAGKVGQLRRDPFAMLPFCGYHMGDYFAHWLKVGAQREAREPAAALLRELVPAGRRAASSCGRATARTAAC